MAGGAKINRLTQISSAVLASIRNAVTKLVTTNYTFQEGEGAYSHGPVMDLTPILPDNAAGLEIYPSPGTGQAYLNLYTFSDIANSNVLSLSQADGESSLICDRVGTGSFQPLAIYASGKRCGFEVDGSIVPSGPIIFHSSQIFASSEITGNGSPQDTAHGLGRTPKIAIAYITAVAGSDTVSAVTSDGTNCTVTAHNGTKYRILAL